MSTIERTLVLNPVEPAPISMKFRSGLETRVQLQYFQQNGAPYNTDFGAQMYLISRSNRTVKAYQLPATDLVNGRATAFIPAGDIKDPNGYNVQIIGTVTGEPRLIARGSASVYETEALGVIPVDIIDTIDLTFTYEQPASFDVALWQDAGKTTPYDLTATVVAARVYPKQGAPAQMAFDVTVIDANKVRLTLTVEQVNELPPDCWWNLQVTTNSGTTTLAQGNVHVIGQPLPIFISATYVYTFNKPTMLTVPASGEIQQCANAPDILRVSMYDKDGTDQSLNLKRMLDGDSIIVGTTTWTVVSADAITGYFQFIVDPPVFDGLSGDQSFTFKKG